MTTEELAHLLLTSMFAAVADTLLEEHKKHAFRLAKSVHRRLWKREAPTDEEMGD